MATTGEVDTYSFQTPSVTTRDASVTLRNMISGIPMIKGAVKKSLSSPSWIYGTKCDAENL